MPALRRPPATDAAARGRGSVLLASDGVRLSVRHDPPLGRHLRELAFVVAHGFTGSWRRPDVRAVVGSLRRGAAARGVPAGVVSFDFRGHGESTGESTVGDLEVLDLDAAVGWARLLGYRRVVSVGWSMGACVAVRQGAVRREPVDAVVAVSGPSRWQYRGTAPMRRLHLGVETRAGRQVLARAYATRVCRDRWSIPPEPPDAAAARLRPTPLLVVHGDQDLYFPLDHARWLVDSAQGSARGSAGESAQLWVEPGFGHAETAATPDLVRRVAAWVCATVAPAPDLPGCGG
jgi:pimeloyl-ACP methyl ester carboxylesterase